MLLERLTHRSRASSGKKQKADQDAAEVMPLQQMYGNRAVGRMLKALHTEEGETEQRADTVADQHRRLSLEQFAASIGSAQVLRIAAKDMKRQANVNVSGVDTPVHKANASGLLAPYKEIVLWLNYKANMQGESPLMKRFEALSIPQKKLALYRMAGSGKLEFKQFIRAMTLYNQLERWVNWKAFQSAVSEARQVRTDQLSEDTMQQLFGDEQTSSTTQDDGAASMLQGGLSALFAGIGMLGLFASDEEEEQPAKQESAVKRSTIAELAAQGSLGMLLLGDASVKDNAAAIRTFDQQRGTKEAIVDRYVRMPSGLKGDAAASMRSRMLAQYGFASSSDCYARLMQELARFVHTKAVLEKAPAYAALLSELGMKPGPDQAEAATIAKRWL